MAITAYHGTLHQFDRFDSSKVGTGEGMQHYGYGLYFANLQSTAGAYAEGFRFAMDGAPFMLAWHLTGQRFGGTSNEKLNTLLVRYRGNFDRILSWIDGNERTMYDEVSASEVANIRRLANALRDRLTCETAGYLYNVVIDGDRDQFFDCNVLFDRQPEAIRRAIGETFSYIKGHWRYKDKRDVDLISATIRKMRQLGNPIEPLLSSAGYLGIRYLDKKSWGVSNYVVFDADIVRIISVKPWQWIPPKVAIPAASVPAGAVSADRFVTSFLQSLKVPALPGSTPQAINLVEDTIGDRSIGTPEAGQHCRQASA